MPAECMGVFLFLVGNKHEGMARLGGALGGEGVEEVAEAAADGPLLEVDEGIELGGPSFLLCGHATRAAPGRVGEIEDEAGARGDGDGDLGGEELGDVEADEAVDGDSLGLGGEGSKEGVEG